MAIAKILSSEQELWTSFALQDGVGSVTGGWISLNDLTEGGEPPISISGHPKLVAPLEAGARVVCIGLNYRAHAEESGHPIPKHPVVFFRTIESFVGPDEPMILPEVSDRFDWEGELAVVIGTGGHKIPESRAMDHILGYTCLNDGSLRDWQKHTSQFSPGKNFDRSGSIGPIITTVQEVGSPEQMQLSTRLNGETVQQSGVDDLIFPVAKLIAYVSTFLSLRTGDVIATGTPSGVGGARKPPRFMKAGDQVEVEISGVGLLCNSIVAEG